VLARVSDPQRLKAALRVPETQVRDVQIGQHAEIDTRNGFIPGTVIRVDPASIEGTVTVDVQLDGDLPRGARPDLSVDGTIELERLDDVLYVGRPVYGQPESTISLFKIQPDGQNTVKLWLNKSSFDQVVAMLGQLEQAQGIAVQTLAMTPADGVGLIDARITLMRGGS
jgi:hypothetical protein